MIWANLNQAFSSFSQASDFNLNNWVGENTNDGIGWRVLEMTWMISNGKMIYLFFLPSHTRLHCLTHIVFMFTIFSIWKGMLLWIDAFEWLALYGVLVSVQSLFVSASMPTTTFLF
jgi:hypothetical protein